MESDARKGRGGQWTVHRAARARFFRPFFETLEDRRLLAVFQVDLSPLGGALNDGANPYTQDHAVGLAALNETSPPASSATGNETGTGITYDDVTNSLAFQFAYGSDFGFVDLGSNFSDAHIHGAGVVQFPAANVSAGILHSLAATHTPGSTARTGSFTGSVTLTAGQEAMLFDNELYVNIHSATFSGGEIRGQLIPVVTDFGTDFGDAPDPLLATAGNYPTLLASNGARHTLGSGLTLGSGVDAEDDGQPNAAATGDDINGAPDDEDGVTFGTLRQGRQTGVVVVASLTGKLDAFVDFNADGDFADTGEKVFDNVSVVAGSNNLAFRVPSTAADSNTYARFRISTAGGLTFNGLASDGEVEDYAVRIKQGTDLGDAPNTYLTTLASNGARHLLGGPLFLGAVVDGDVDGVPNATATGDDNNFAPDDEDGVTFGNLRQGRQTVATVVASSSGLLDAFVDFNADGDFADSGEKIFNNVSVVAGTNTLAFRVPSTAADSNTYARFRISTVGGLSFDGLATNGEVEDYAVRIKQGTDFGDAPDTFATTLASNGARHVLGSPLFLGAAVDGDNDGQPNATATGDDINLAPDDEDGVAFGLLVAGQPAIVTVTASAAGKLDAFADFNHNGSFADAGEKIFDNVSVSASANVLNFDVPSGATAGQTSFRFRVSTVGSLSFNGSANDGEVEDHSASVQPFTPPPSLAAEGEARPESRVESQELDQKPGTRRTLFDDAVDAVFADTAWL